MVQGQLHKKMKTNEQITKVETKRYLVILHGGNTATVVDTPFTSLKMDIYHQLHNLRMKAGKLDQTISHKFYDIPQELVKPLMDVYESHSWMVDLHQGAHWDNLYKSLLHELDGLKPRKKTEVTEHTPERDADGDRIVKLPKPTKPMAKKESKPAKKDGKK